MYLYLTEAAWADAWINGGAVPFFPATKYLSDIRQGTMTPDEVLQRQVQPLKPFETSVISAAQLAVIAQCGFPVEGAGENIIFGEGNHVVGLGRCPRLPSTRTMRMR